MNYVHTFESFLNEAGAGPKIALVKVIDGNLKEVMEGTLMDLSMRFSNAVYYAEEKLPKFKGVESEDVKTLDDLLEIINYFYSNREKKRKMQTRTVIGPKMFHDIEVGDRTLFDIWMKEGFPPLKDFSEKYKGLISGHEYGI